MSLKEFFNQAILKTVCIDFLRNRGRFENLPYKLKKPFRCQMQKSDDQTLCLDGYNSITVEFSSECREDFEDRYPSCLSIDNLDGPLVCVHEFELKLTHKIDDEHVSEEDGQRVWTDLDVDVSLLVRNMKVITFDNVFQGAAALTRFRHIREDPQIVQHMQFMLHHLMKTAAVKWQESVDMAADFQHLREQILHDSKGKFDQA